ncbi:type II secretory pathway pseudopilin PulG [Streptomyces phaeochromogenes]|uniref:hypothetical protein n=1 Tax=Streptomyces phaeochromogenes TaxID=1923 RepID=UPI0027905929|nr:hypothetical protein [Streptomyces phaeochromogenes]MDQ0956089.1 type II secretory pathway pseudopilin PulG [Streptomyces phaeochromogenes]
MREQWVTLTVAIVGVVGTLGAALLTQSRAERTKRLELEAAAQQQREDRQHADNARLAEQVLARQRELLDLRRACYISLNTASRQYLTAQINLLHAMRNGMEVDTSLEQMEARRLAHRDSYAEAQMIVPAPVLHAASAASRTLNRGYGILKQMLALPPEAHALQDFEENDVATSWAGLSDMRAAMRGDLGVDDIPQ